MILSTLGREYTASNQVALDSFKNASEWRWSQEMMSKGEKLKMHQN